MMLSMGLATGLDTLPDGFGVAALALVFVVITAMSLARRPVAERRPVPIRSRQRG